MKTHSGMRFKIFAAFLFIAAITVFLLEVKVYFPSSGSLEIRKEVETRSGALAETENGRLKIYFKDFKYKLKAAGKDPFLQKASKDITKAYGKLAFNFSQDIVSAIAQELKAVYTDSYGEALASKLLPSSDTEIIAQATAIRGNIRDRELFNALAQDENVKAYLIIEKNINERLEKLFAELSPEDIIITSPKGTAVYVYNRKSALGSDAASGDLGGYESDPAADFSVSKAAKGGFYLFESLFPDTPRIGAFAASKLAGGWILGAAGGNGLNSILSAGDIPSGFSVYLSAKSGDIAAAFTAPGDKPSLVLSSSELAGYLGAKREYMFAEKGKDYYSLYSMPFTGVAPGLFLTVAAHYPAPVFAFSDIFFWAVFITLLLIISYILASLLARKTIRLRDSFVAAAEGDMFVRINSGTKDELRDMANAFNLIYDKLRALLEEGFAGRLISRNDAEEKNDLEKHYLEEKEFTDAVINTRGILLVIVDDNNIIVRTNDPLKKVFDSGYNIGRNLLDAVYPHYREGIDTAIKKVKATGENVLLSTISEYSGEKVYVEWMLALIRGIKGDKVYVAGIGLNVTENYAMRENLREREEMLQIIMSHAQDAIIVSDEQGGINVVNEAAKKMLGSSFEELRGKSVIPAVIPQEYESEFLDDINNDATLELYAVHKSGKRFPIELSVSKIKVFGKTNTLYIMRDVSARKKKEADIYDALEKARLAEKAKSDFLANMSHEIRTPLNGIVGFLSLLKQTSLNKDQLEYLNIIDSSTDSLLNIINDILDFSKIESGKMTLEAIEFNATEVFENVTELYAAKATEKNINLFVVIDPEMPEWLTGDQLRLKQILSNLLSNAIKFTEAGGSVTVKIIVESKDAKTCWLRISVQDTGIGIDKEKQALIFDAFSQADASVTRKYGGSGLGLSICMSIAKLMGGSGLQINSEEGRGSEFYFIAPFVFGANQSKERPVFTDVVVGLYDCSDNTCPFRSAIRDYLSIIKCEVKVFNDIDELKNLGHVDIICMGYRATDERLIEQIHELMPDKPTIYLACDRTAGKIKTMESKTVRTLTQHLNVSKFLDAFTFLIRKNTTITHEAVDRAPSEQIFSGHVLVVEDNAVNRRLADIMLRQFGLTVELAINGKEAVNLFLKNKFDIIFMDIHMPLLDGVEATKEIIRIEKDSGAEHTPIVALTANVIQEDRDSYIEAGMDGFLAKPMEKTKLEAVLIQFLDSEEAKKLLETLGKIFEIDDVESVKSIMMEFNKVAHKQVISMREALKEKDMKKLASFANSLKGAAMNLRFNNIVMAAKRIEGHIADGSETDYESIINDVETELKRLEHIVR